MERSQWHNKQGSKWKMVEARTGFATAVWSEGDWRTRGCGAWSLGSGRTDWFGAWILWPGLWKPLERGVTGSDLRF